MVIFPNLDINGITAVTIRVFQPTDPEHGRNRVAGGARRRDRISAEPSVGLLYTLCKTGALAPIPAVLSSSPYFRDQD